jgi:hypothetical protein
MVPVELIVKLGLPLTPALSLCNKLHLVLANNYWAAVLTLPANDPLLF